MRKRGKLKNLETARDRSGGEKTGKRRSVFQKLDVCGSPFAGLIKTPYPMLYVHL
jgi:hypothetical protein